MIFISFTLSKRPINILDKNATCGDKYKGNSFVDLNSFGRLDSATKEFFDCMYK